jgi:hypothetical protein
MQQSEAAYVFAACSVLMFPNTIDRKDALTNKNNKVIYIGVRGPFGLNMPRFGYCRMENGSQE